MLWQTGVRQLLFCLSAERAHNLSMGAFSALTPAPVARLLRKRYTVLDPRLRTKLFGLNFQNPVGLAAGFDKDAKWFHKLSSLGFSHVEVGTITGQPQPGNPQPRLFRIPLDQAIINRMGFNNHGADAAARRLARIAKADTEDVLGINIGKTKVVPLGDSTRDYLFSFERLFTFADYFTVNVSSPNTPGLRELQNREHLLDLLSSIMKLNEELANDHDVARKPILLKIAPDVTNHQLDDIVSMLKEVELDGIIATNTTISRDGLKTHAEKISEIGAGGLSGRPLTSRSRQVVSELYQRVGAEIPIVGVGGIMSGEDAWRMIRAGASLVQIYTGFIYGGPSIVRSINRHLLKRLEEHGMENIQHAVGGGKQFD